MRPGPHFVAIGYWGFNPRTRKGCDGSPPSVSDLMYVSIHAPVKDATPLWCVYSVCVRGFNPRTRKGCDNKAGMLNVSSVVSIHAPVKDATVLTDIPPALRAVSIHAPVKDATLRITVPKAYLCFNPRTRKGCD